MVILSLLKVNMNLQYVTGICAVLTYLTSCFETRAPHDSVNKKCIFHKNVKEERRCQGLIKKIRAASDIGQKGHLV